MSNKFENIYVFSLPISVSHIILLRDLMESHTRATLSHHKSEKPAQREILPEA